MDSSARMGDPAATQPTMGMRSRSRWSLSTMARPLQSPFSMRPRSWRRLRWKWAVEGDLSPTASQISRTEGA